MTRPTGPRPTCREGLHTACLHGGFYGSPEVGGLQAEYARIPLADGSLVVVPRVDETSDLLDRDAGEQRHLLAS